MKKFSILLLAFLSSTIILAQKKEKISGSKTIVTKQKNIKNFSAIEVQDNLVVS